MDGVTLGHPRCNYTHCLTRLESPRDRFCPEHQSLTDQCAIHGCSNAARPRFRTCHLPEHSEYEAERRARGTALYRLRKRAEAQSLGSVIRSLPSDSAPLDDLLDDPELMADIETLIQPKPSKATEAKQKRTMKAALTRRWTFNEQLMVRPCGIIISRATFYEAESPSNALVCCVASRTL